MGAVDGLEDAGVDTAAEAVGEYWLAAAGAYGQSLPKRMCPGRAKASSVGRAVGPEDSAVSQ